MVRGPAFCNQERKENRAALEAEMNAVPATQTIEHWVEVLEAAGVPCGQVHTYAQLFDDPQVRHRGLVQYASDAELGEVPHIGTRSRSARACGCAASPPGSASITPRSFGRLRVIEAEVKCLHERRVL